MDVEIIDAQFYDMSLEEFVDRVQAINPKYVGISILTTEYKETLHLSVRGHKRTYSRMSLSSQVGST